MKYINSSGYANSLSRTGGGIPETWTRLLLPGYSPPGRRQKIFKHRIIKSAASLFNLSERETEALANKAGLSFRSADNFNGCFRSLLDASNKSHRKIYEEALVSERMFYLILAGRIPTKITLLALLVALDMSLHEIEELLLKAGYVLSPSIAFDMVVKHFLTQSINQSNRITAINNTLYDLGLPLLMTREKRNSE